MSCVADAFDAKAAEGCAEKVKTYPEERNEKPDKVLTKWMQQTVCASGSVKMFLQKPGRHVWDVHPTRLSTGPRYIGGP